MESYLDIAELAVLLGQSQSTIKRKLSTHPHCLPPRMHLPGTKMLRWRSHDVENWKVETGWSRSGA
jgi:predicted DNA-binding transcriptional regulator AlpA